MDKIVKTHLDNKDLMTKLNNINTPNGLVIQINKSTTGFNITISGSANDVEYVIEQLTTSGVKS